MEYAYSILMGIFAAALLFYAGLMALTKDSNMLPYRSRQSVKPKNPKAYMTQLAKVVALAPALSAIAGLWSLLAALIVLLAGLVGFLWLGTKLMRGVQENC